LYALNFIKVNRIILKLKYQWRKS